MDASSISTTHLFECLFNHVALPPRLPGQSDKENDAIERALVDRLLNAVCFIRDLPKNDLYQEWDAIRSLLQTCKTLNAGGKLDKTSLLTEFKGLEHNELLILHIREQNAGVLVRRENSDQMDKIIIEAFETSATSEQVLASENILQWDFPGSAVVILYSEFTNSDFLHNLAQFLEQASTESIKIFAARTHKARSFALESRDVVDPSLITQMLMTLLEGNGNRIVPSLLRKRVRDDVCWTDGAENPWRRCAFWLVLRVGVQRHLCTRLGSEVGRVHYKFLICLVLSHLMDDCLHHLSPESLYFLKTKLCRRLVKLDMDKERAAPDVRPSYVFMFLRLGPFFDKTTQNVVEHVKGAWENFKSTIRRPIPLLPRFAEEGDLQLTLPNSGTFLEQVLKEHLHGYSESRSSEAHGLPKDYEGSAPLNNPFKTDTNRHFLLSKLEVQSTIVVPDSKLDCDLQCMEFANKIEIYLNSVGGAYDSNPEQKSTMLLTVMELWVSMDERATKIFCLLKDFNPGFPPEILDVLQLPLFRDMCRLQKIQGYLQNRHTMSKSSQISIFHNPAKGCFSERFFNESQESARLQDLHQRIETAAKAARRMKEKEWRGMCAEYEDLIKEISRSTCLYTASELPPYSRVHAGRLCTKCFLQRRAEQFRIQVHENPLPSDPIQARAVVFELGCPNTFAAYRDATWRILGTLAYPKPTGFHEPRLLLCDYSELKEYVKFHRRAMSLASTTKSFLKTHYLGVSLPVGLDEVCLPNGLNLVYYDNSAKMWPGRQPQSASFARHCLLSIPSASPFSSLLSSVTSTLNANGASSSEIIASQTRCPSGLNVHEFAAFQGLIAGKIRRWPQILRELGESNLNFSTEATVLLISHLALQVGPAHQADPLRVIHRVFGDESFCMRLLDQLDQRMSGISSNWRETYCMEIVVTLILRLLSASPLSMVVDESFKLLKKVRDITFRWVSLLRMEIYKATDATISLKCSNYAVWAALLCRRTFAVYVDGEQNLQRADLSCFIECSITLKDNLFGDPAALPPLLRAAFIRDLKMVYRMRAILRQSLEVNPDSMASAINNIWPESEDSLSKSLSELKFLPYPNEWWIVSTIDATQHSMLQTLHFHILEGHLLLDGQPLGKLPAEYRKNIEQLVPGHQSLLTRSSALSGMTYMLANRIYGHEIHIGFRKAKLFTRACVKGKLFEFIPRETFGGPSRCDLPASLVENYVHWLDLDTGTIEIRDQTELWKSNKDNWFLDFPNRLAKRRNVTLVNPQSLLFLRVAGIFDRFEYPYRLTILQPVKGPLEVQLRRLELSFFVNPKKLLESVQLQSEVDPNQDAQTWYGLNSKLVLREVKNPHQRSIIIPTGDISCQRNSFHVTVEVLNTGTYGRFTINNILGRLDCPTEPVLLYLKARYHAYTSSFIPDRLTGRTGTEEALHCLNSGFSSPWTSLNHGPHRILLDIAKLTPRRDYYPKDLKVMQQVFWDARLTTTIQHDGFRPIVEAILEKSQQLSVFTSQKTELPSLEPAGDSHLSHRSYVRRCLYQRPDSDANEEQASPDVPYDPQDRFPICRRNSNVFQSVSILRNQSSRIYTSSDLAGILQGWSVIGGCDQIFDKTLLSDRLSVDFALEWGPLLNLCRSSEAKDKYHLMFLFAVISFRDDVDMDTIRTLIAFSILEDLKALDPPKWPSYAQFRHRQVPREDFIFHMIKSACNAHHFNKRRPLPLVLSSRERSQYAAAELAREQRIESDGKALAQFLIEQWPCLEPTIQGFSKPVLIDVARALKTIQPEWQRLFQNLELSHYIQKVQIVLDSHCAEGITEAPNIGFKKLNVISTRYRGGEIPSLSQNLLRKTGLVLRTETFPAVLNKIIEPINDEPCHSALPSPYHPEELVQTFPTLPSLYNEIEELENITNEIRESRSTVRKQYRQDMIQSLNALKIYHKPSKQEKLLVSLAAVLGEISKAREIIWQLFNRICEIFERDDSRVKWLQKGGLWPCITPVTLLEQLRSTSTSVFGKHVKENIVLYACSITKLQHLMRMEDALLKQNHRKLLEEQQNEGHGNWQPLNHPDWLLLEIDANMLIRHDQVDVALATISPASGFNSVLQMNMGQGKTSCIMPMVATVLADSKKLLRVIVPKPLLLQTAQLLQARLGGLLGRQVRHVPFSRKTSTKLDTIKAFLGFHENVRKSSGVMLALPDHILSFKLSGLQRLSDACIEEASPMIRIQSWMNSVSRDVIDECDFTLAVRTQLIYPSGSQITVDGHPHRWKTAEALLRLIEDHLWNLQYEFPHSIEVVHRPQGGFPVIFFLRKDVEDSLLARLVDDICSGRTSIVPTRECSTHDCIIIKQFISNAKVQQDVVERIRRIFPEKPAMVQNIYLLRGLLVHRILLSTLKKRWNVQYGLHPDRDPIAVPFHAKGVPSEQAEWGHPDVAILFTCLSFYYIGLNVVQLRQSIAHVLKSDDPSSEYDRWTHGSRLPDSLREWNAINIDDEVQLMEIWQNMRYNMMVIDYFLNNFVFPKHAKQFQMKLQASGWDIPLFSSSNASSTSSTVMKASKALTTGFSGTNDTKMLLPLTVKQADLPGLSHTNAEVLTSLLQPRNRQYVLAADNSGKHLPELDLLRMISQRNIRILIDVGAQILEMDNLSLAKAWLRIYKDAPAAVYFDSQNKPSVLYQHGHIVPLLASPFADDSGACLVYLDEAHTRGTDLKMPAHARGAITLGLNLQKDTVVQAAMRLRQLATSQSVVFFAPPEVHQCILDLRKNKFSDKIDSHDVICWLLEQTCDGIEQLQPLYFSQGVDFCRRTQAASEYSSFLTETDQRDAYLGVLQQREIQTLKQLYEPKMKPKPVIISQSSSPGIGAYMRELNSLRRGFQDTGGAVHGSALQEVEQEREVAFEVEAVRELQKPVHYLPLAFSGLHKDILGFVKTGRLAAASAGYEQAFVTLRRTALGLKYGISSEATASKLFVSTEFTKTIRLTQDRANDNFLRPVNWILWSFVSETALIVTPEEAEILITMFRDVETHEAHLITYAAAVTRKTLHFNGLQYYAMPSLPKAWKAPRWLTIELGIFAGRLYFDYEEYDDLREFLSLPKITANSYKSIDNAMTIPLIERGVEAEISTSAQQRQSFTKNPLTFLREWLAVRRKGQDFAHTPMGYVCQDKPLTASHPFFARVESDAVPVTESTGMRDDQGPGENVDAFGDDDEAVSDDDGVDVDDD